MTTDDTRPLTQDSPPDDETTAESPAVAGPAPAPAPAPASASASEQGAPPAPPAPVYRGGPAPFALVLGLLGLALAVGVLVGETTSLTVDWAVLGPWLVVAGGVVVAVVGVLGLRSSRDRT